MSAVDGYVGGLGVRFVADAYRQAPVEGGTNPMGTVAGTLQILSVASIGVYAGAMLLSFARVG
jgi:hypothetical protein